MSAANAHSHDLSVDDDDDLVDEHYVNESACHGDVLSLCGPLTPPAPTTMPPESSIKTTEEWFARFEKEEDDDERRDVVITETRRRLDEALDELARARDCDDGDRDDAEDDEDDDRDDADQPDQPSHSEEEKNDDKDSFSTTTKNTELLSLTLTIARACHNNGDDEDSLHFYKRALSLGRRSAHAHPEVVGDVLSAMAVGPMDGLGMHDASVVVLGEALRVHRQAAAGLDNARVAATLHRMGNAHFRAGNFDEARRLYREAVDVAEGAWGNDEAFGNTNTYRHGRRGNGDNSRSITVSNGGCSEDPCFVLQHIVDFLLIDCR